MRMPIALRRLALVAATTSLLATLPFSPAHAGVDDVKNVDPISAANSGNATVTFNVTTDYLPVPEPTVKFVRAADATDVITISNSDNVTYDEAQSKITATASLLRRNPGAWNIEVSGYVAGSQDQVVDSCVSCFTVLAQTPTITPFSKTVGGGASGIALTINGTNFTDAKYCSSGSCAGKPTVSVSGAGVTLVGTATGGDDVAATNGTTIQKLVSVAAGAATGPRDITVTNTDGKSAVCAGCLVVGVTPTLTAVAPAGLAPGASNRTVTLTGTGFAPNATVTITLPGTTNQTNNRVTITNPVVNSPTQITLSVSVEDVSSSSITLGDRNVTVTNPTDAGTVTRGDLFDVIAKPTVTSLSYLANTGVNQYGQGAVNRTLRVNGTGFQPGAVVSFATPAGITINSTTVVDATKIDVALTLNQVGSNEPTAATNAVKVSNPDGGSSGTTNFTISNGPRLDSVSPASRGRGETVDLTLKGVNFSTGGVTVEIEDAVVTQTIVDDAQTIRVKATIGSGLNIAGPSDVRVTNNSDKGSYLCDDVCFTVVNLQVNTISPSNVLNEGTPTFTITGSGFNSDAVATLRKHGTGTGQVADVTGTTTSVNGDGTSMTVKFPINGIAPGGWALRVTNPTSNPGVGVCTCELTVVAPQPDITSLDRTSLGEGADDELFTVNGTNFAPAATLTFSNSKVTVVPGSVVVTPTKITALVDVAPGAVNEDATGVNEAKTVTVTNTDGVNDSHAFGVAKAPLATSLDIKSRARGTQTVITLTGDDIVSGATFVISGIGVTTGPTTLVVGEGVVNHDKLSATFTVAADAPLGARTITVRNPDGGRDTCDVAADCTLTVNAAPTVTSVSPAKAAAGAITVVNVLGTGFQTGPTVDAGPGVTATATYVSPTQLSVSLNVVAGAATGNRSLKVTNTDGGTATLADAYKVFTVPGSPTNVTATGGEGEATVSWTAPASDGNDPLTSYRVIADPGPVTFTTTGASTTTATVKGLTNGTAYKFSVVATNAAGDSAPSAQSAAVTPATKPGAPTAVTATPGYLQATVSWTAPASNGGSPITGYTVRSIPGDITKSVAGNVTQTVVEGLTAGVPYKFVVSATNAVGTGADSAESNAVAPTTLPGAPRTVAATAGNGSATVTWAAPESDGGTAVLDYTVTSTPGNKQVTVNGTTATVSGLTNGTAYTFVVTARNANGTGPASDSSAPVTPRTVPGAPTNVTALPTNGGADVSWTAPASDGGSAITAYVVKAAPGGKTVEVPGNELTASVPGLNNGTAYTFTVTAKNVAGSGAESAPSAAVTPRTVPGAPASVSASRGNGSATVTWTAPASNGGSAVTGYTVTSTPGGKVVEVNGTTLSAVVEGLDNGTSYTFAVHATNVAGPGPAATSNAVVPATVPGAPTAVSATPADSAANVAWTAPASNGGEAVTGYVVTASPGDHTVTVGGDVLGATVSGLTNGTAYTFTVKAVNAVGTGAASAPSDAVTPRTVAGAPTGVTATFGDTDATVSWTAPASNGGAPVTGYTVTSTPDGKTATVAGDVLTAVVGGLTNGTEYTFAVVATNAAGTSAPGTSNAVTPAGVPFSPTGVTATAGHAAATVTWTASNGNGRPVTGYTVTASPGGASQTVMGTSATIGGLTNGVLYTFSVKATNAVGDSTAAVSNAVRPTWVSVLTSAATTKIVSGGTSVVTGRLSRSDGVGLQGGSIAIYRKVAPATTFSFVRNVTTGTNGVYRTSFTLTKHTRFKAVFGGAPGFDAATAPERVTQVAHRITAAYAFSGRTVTVSGSVSPNAAGRTVYLRHRRADGTYAVVATKTIASNGTYKLSKTLSRGTYYLTMYIPKSATNSANQTPLRTTRIT